jgi:predicted nucleic acid-binding protein
VLVDSSVWIPYLRGDESAEIDILVSALKRMGSVWVAPTILQEVLQGADRPERFAKWERVIGELPLLVEPDARTAALAAARLYARCRWAGVTPRSANDCLIAVHAVAAGMPLLQCDRDFRLIARVERKLVLLPSEK